MRDRMGWGLNGHDIRDYRKFTLRWTRIDPEGPGLHSPKRPGDVGWDLEAAEDVVLYPHTQMDVPTNIRVQLPWGCWGEIRSRSSIARLGAQVEAGVLDNGYTGPLFVLMRNLNRGGDTCASDGVIVLRKGQRIAQLVLHVMAEPLVQEVETLDHDPRRGEAAFGSTGTGLEYLNAADGSDFDGFGPR